jgi:hypothetical protein
MPISADAPLTPSTFSARLLTPLGLSLIAFVLALPALWGGLAADDYFHRMILLHRGPLGAALDATFDFFSFVPVAQRDAMIDLGVVPWWSDPQIRIALARPVTALTHQFDYLLWPDNFVLQHLHSLFWFAAATGLVAMLFRRVHGATPLAALAGLLFAVADAHALPATWLANRNALLCLVFGTATVLCHIDWRERGHRSSLAAALLFLGLGFGSGEATFGGLAYVAAWQITEERESWRARLLPLAPYAAVVVAWRLLYNYSGYGTAGSALYVDPGHDPLAFLGQMVQRWPLLFASQWLKAPVDLWLFLPERTQQGIAIAAALFTLTLGLLLAGVAKRERLVRFWLLGMGLSLIPVCAAFPMDRLLIFAGVGAFGTMALLAKEVAIGPWRNGSPAGFQRRAVVLLLIVHLPLGAVMLVARTATFDQIGLIAARGATGSPDGPEVANQTFIYVNGNDFSVVYTSLIRIAEGQGTSPRRLAQLSSVFARQAVSREDARTLVIRSEGGFLNSSADRIMANPKRPFHANDRIERPDFVAEVRSVTSDGRPQEVAFHFRRDLEDAAYRWLFWRELRVVDFVLPKIGESVTLPSLLD